MPLFSRVLLPYSFETIFRRFPRNLFLEPKQGQTAERKLCPDGDVLITLSSLLPKPELGAVGFSKRQNQCVYTCWSAGNTTSYFPISSQMIPQRPQSADHYQQQMESDKKSSRPSVLFEKT